MSGKGSLLPAERRRLILEHIETNRNGKIDELAALLRVSVATVRRDLAAMTMEGLVSRTHGGAVPITSTAFERLYSEKKLLFQDEKRRIGEAAAALVADGEALILDSGSTTLEIARSLTEYKHLTIITNDLFIASNVVFHPTTTLMVTGGVRREGFSVLIGPVAEDLLRRVRVNKSFLSADAVDLAYGVTNATFPEASMKQLIIEAAKEVILVVDHSKFGNVALAKVCSLDKIHRVITDSGIEDSMLQGMQSLGLQVTIA